MKDQDSKSFIDRPTIKKLKEVKKEFNRLKKDLDLEKYTNVKEIFKIISKNPEFKKIFVEQFAKFKKNNFNSVGADIKNVVPKDYREENGYADYIRTPLNKEIYFSLNKAWLEMSLSYVKTDDLISTGIRSNNFFFAPGGRFREFYYWDSYWIFKGLLIQNMEKSAAIIVKNFINMIESYGYVPNGSRSYYRNRSQPPFFPTMLMELYNHNKDKYKDLVLNRGLSAAIKEHQWFMNNRTVKFEKNNKQYTMFRYNVTSNFPRPESFKEDLETAKERGGNTDETYSNIKTAAESGWDFSTRWLEDESKLSTICIRDIIPVDLNALIYNNEQIISKLCKEINDIKNEKNYKDLAHKRAKDINEVLWNDEKGVWNDYHFKKEKSHPYTDKRFYFSNIMPLFYGIKPPRSISSISILNRYKQILFGYPGGIPVSGEGEIISNEQWDFPNAWAPHQSLLMNYLKKEGMNDLAYHTGRTFFNNVQKSFEVDKLFYEKYDCMKLGRIGKGGEYLTQTGFGWTNGTILEIFNYFRERLDSEFNFEESKAKIFKYLEQFANEMPNTLSNQVFGLENGELQCKNF